MDLDAITVDTLRRRGGAKWARCEPDLLAAWVADMDFPVAEPVRAVLRRMVEDSDLGYPAGPDPDGLATVFARRMRDRFAWEVDPVRVEVLTDVVQGMHLAVELFSGAGDGVVTPLPIYPPFLTAVRSSKRRPVWQRYVAGSRGYEIDFDRLRAEMLPRTRVLLLCNPHNPTGRVLREDELRAVADLAIERDLVVVSDEIHADLVYPGARHLPLASLGPEIASRTITLTSATKAFNIAGLRCAVAVFGSAQLQQRFLRIHRHARGGIGSLGLAASAAAWTDGQAWQDEVLRYLEGNRDLVRQHAAERWPEVRHHAPEATYLAWLDLSALELDRPLHSVFLHEGRVMLSDGGDFGDASCVRLNFATPRPVLRQILQRMDGVLAGR